MDTCTNCQGPLPTTHGTTGPDGHKFCDACAGISEALGIGACLPAFLYERDTLATTWTGLVMGTIVHRTAPPRTNRVNVRVRMLDGSIWYGTGPTVNGNYLRLRPMKRQ